MKKVKHYIAYQFWYFVSMWHIFFPPYNPEAFRRRDYKVTMKMKKNYESVWPDRYFGVCLDPDRDVGEQLDEINPNRIGRQNQN